MPHIQPLDVFINNETRRIFLEFKNNLLNLYNRYQEFELFEDELNNTIDIILTMYENNIRQLFMNLELSRRQVSNFLENYNYDPEYLASLYNNRQFLRFINNIFPANIERAVQKIIRIYNAQ